MTATDAISVARIVLVVALATQSAAVATFIVERARAAAPAPALTPR